MNSEGGNVNQRKVRRKIARLQRALADQHRAAEAARKAAGRWEREAVMRATSVAGALSAEILAGRRLAAAVRAYLEGSSSDASDLGAALCFFDEVVEEREGSR